MVDSVMGNETAVADVVGHKKGVPKNDKIHGGGCGGEPEHEIHIWTERQRRKKMRDMFSNLHALVPQLPAKADKSTVVDEAVRYIKVLQQTLQTMQRKRIEKLSTGTILTDSSEPSTMTSQTPHAYGSTSRESFLAGQGLSEAMNSAVSVPFTPACFQTWFSPNVVMNMCGDDAQFSVCSLRKPGLLATIFYILEKHNLDVVSTHISSDQHRRIYIINVHHAGGASPHYRDALSVEDTFKLAAGEMNLWLLSC
ncbi:transcription factor bHLH95-like [Tripterygium wilfordii]|uniref:Transcription factor bHLH95-like n=1 Tax=Tripterygium wilfordii TaxID=458696 RepID=A0A7J7DKZ2_TRIWF|nr:transcription factor bHLH95-like [Tripterygium wilfordii]KAF5747035.1 transcription factor bHLH95-like [Tripterygium wilfordii]